MIGRRSSDARTGRSPRLARLAGHPRSPRLARLRVGIVGAAMLALLASTPGASMASFTDSEHATSTALTAIVVPAPIIDTCVAQSLLVVLTLTPRVTITWHYPTAGYTATNARYWYYDTGLLTLVSVSLGSGVTTSGPVSGTYTSVFQGSLLAGLLGGSADVGVSAAHSSGWLSTVSMAHANFPLLVGTGTCTIA